MGQAWVKHGIEEMGTSLDGWIAEPIPERDDTLEGVQPELADDDVLDGRRLHFDHSSEDRTASTGRRMLAAFSAVAPNRSTICG